MKDVVTNTKKDGIVIINKFKDTNSIDISSSLINAFKIYYQIQSNKK